MEQNIKCYNCKKLKQKSEFSKDRKSHRGYHGYCKECKNNIAHKRKGWLTPKYRERVKEYRRKQKMLAIKYKGGYCIDCNYEGHHSAFDFHHTSDKTDNPSNLLKNGFEAAKKELDKCILLCKNCHAIRHYIDGGVNKKGLNQHSGDRHNSQFELKENKEKNGNAE